MAKAPAAQESFQPVNRKAWRNWLEKNHKTRDRIWVALKKKNSEKPGIEYEDAVLEALCFGWIDSTTHRKDDDFYEQMFAKRKPGSVWSASNKKRIEILKEQQLIAPSGWESIELAMKNGSWSRIDLSEANEMPPDLKSAFRKNKTAAENFKSFPRSVQKMICQWILMAKRPETRENRVAISVEKAAKNIRARG